MIEPYYEEPNIKIYCGAEQKASLDIMGGDTRSSRFDCNLHRKGSLFRTLAPPDCQGKK